MVVKTKYEIHWMNAECLEEETRTIPRRIIERIYIKKFDNKIINISEGSMAVIKKMGIIASITEGRGGEDLKRGKLQLVR